MNNSKILRLTEGAMIAALYAALGFVFAPISFGGVQVRIAEALCILPIFTPAAIPGLFAGCLIANILGGGIVFDVIFGSLATLIGAFGTYALRKKKRWMAVLPPIISNTLIIPFVLYFGYGINLPIPLLMLLIAIGEIVGCGVLGLLLGKAVERLFHNNMK